MTDDSHQRARATVKHRMAERGWSNAELARAASVDPGTVGDFLKGSRWPSTRVQNKLEKALTWGSGTISALAAENSNPEEKPTVSDRHVVRSLLPSEWSQTLTEADVVELFSVARAAAMARARELLHIPDSAPVYPEV